MDLFLRYCLVLILLSASLMTVGHSFDPKCGLGDCASAPSGYFDPKCGLGDCASDPKCGLGDCASAPSEYFDPKCGLGDCAAAPSGYFDPKCGLGDCASAPSGYVFDPVECGLMECAAAPSDLFDTIKDAKHLSFTDPTNISSKHTNVTESGPSIVLINTWGATIFTLLSCFLLSVHASYFGPHDERLHAILIAFTPGVHSVDQLLRRIYLTDGSYFLFTYLEALREMYSATASICFMRMIDIQLKNHYEVDRLNEILRNKLFTFHYPFNLREPTVYRTSRENLFLMRTFAYQNIASTFVLYVSRILLEYLGVFGEISSHIFQVIYFIFSSIGILAVYAYAQGIDPDIPHRKMARKVGLFKLLMFLLWFQGPGVELMLAAQTYLIIASLIWYCCSQIMDLMPRAE